MSKRVAGATLVIAAILSLADGACVRGDAPAPPSINDQYSAVLAAMKHPQATGILVTEIGPDSPAGAAGLQAGDILYHFGGSSVHDLQTLRQLIADVFAAHAAGDVDEKILLGVHRGDQDIVLRIPREPLGIRAIEVDAGVPAVANPLPSPRGSIAIAWDDVIKQQITTSAGDSAYFRIDEVLPALPPAAPVLPTGTAPADIGPPAWLGWQHRSMNVGDGAILGRLDTYHVEPDDPSARIASGESVRFRLRTGDHAATPAFLLDSLEVTLNHGDGSVTTMTAQRAGTALRTQTTITAPTRIVGPIGREVECPINAIIPAGVPLVAAALPQQENAALAVSLLSVRDGISRPGYLLIARGQQRVRDATYWRVDLMHCGVIAESYWFTDQRRLLEVQTPSGTMLAARRVNSQAEASVPISPATQPSRP